VLSMSATLYNFATLFITQFNVKNLSFFASIIVNEILPPIQKCL
jgi:hypothetical protein